jgi:phenylalanyl-tRNA synthetase beta chain
MKILTKWLRAYLPGLPVDDAKLAEDLTLRGIAVDGIYPLGEGNGSWYEMDITTNRVDAMNHYGVAREAQMLMSRRMRALYRPQASVASIWTLTGFAAGLAAGSANSSAGRGKP